MRELSLHLLDIVQNSIEAGADFIEIEIIEDKPQDQFVMEIRDNGRGMSEEELVKALDPFYTTRTTRKVGMGLSLLKANCQATGGDLFLQSQQNHGTTVKAVLGLSHIDCPPLGDLAATMVALVAGSPEVDFCLERKGYNKEYTLDTRELRELMAELPLNNPKVLSWLREFIQEREGKNLTSKNV